MKVPRLLFVAVLTLLLSPVFMGSGTVQAAENSPAPNTSMPTQTAPESTFGWLSLLPAPSTFVRSGFGLYRSTACPCFDRQTWALDVGINLRWHRFLSFDAAYHYGTMILGGNFPTSGYALGLRSALTAQSNHWWDDFYIRAGVDWLSTMGTRDPGQTGVYLRPGWTVEIFPILHLETELSTAYYFGAMEHLDLGFRSGIRFGF